MATGDDVEAKRTFRAFHVVVQPIGDRIESYAWYVGHAAYGSPAGTRFDGSSRHEREPSGERR